MIYAQNLHSSQASPMCDLALFLAHYDTHENSRLALSTGSQS